MKECHTILEVVRGRPLCVAKNQEITLVPRLPQRSLLAVFVWLLYCKQQMLWRPALIHVWTINEPHLPKKKAWILCKVTTFHPSIHKKTWITSFIPKFIFFNVKVSRLYILWDTETQKCGLLPSNCGIDLTGMGVRLDPWYGSEARPFSHLGCADGRTSGHWEDSSGQGRSHRVWDHILQCLLFHPHLQVSRRVRETYQDTLWNGAYNLCTRSSKEDF